jgi:hypothetical protein
MATKKVQYTDNTNFESDDGKGDSISGLRIKDKPFEGQGSEVIGPNSSEAGAGRGKQGGPTAKQVSMGATEKAARDDAAEMKLQERTDKAYENASKGMKHGGSASSRADGIATKGHTRGKMV